MSSRPPALARVLALGWASLLACAEPAGPGSTRGLDASAPSPDAAPAELEPPPSPRRDWVGVFIPAHTVEVAPATAAELERVLVGTGDQVSTGDAIALLDARQVREQITLISAELRRQQATRAAARVDAEQRSEALEQSRVLAASGHVSGLELDEAEFAHRRAETAVAEADAAVDESRARLASLRRQLDDQVLVAPFDGLVAERYLDDGALAGPARPVVRLIAAGLPWVRFAVEPGVVAGGLELGDRVEVRAAPEGPRAWARVRNIAPEVDPSSELIFVEAELEPGSDGAPVGTAAWVVPSPSAAQ